MDQLAALRETVRQAEAAGMPELPGSTIGLEHLRHMLSVAEAGSFDEAKLGRWLGWAQCAVVAGTEATLDDMRRINSG